MDSVHAALVSELIHHLCVEIDLNYDDQHLLASCNDPIRTMQQATALLFIAGHEPPEVYAHVMQRVTRAEADRERPSSEDAPSSEES